MKIKIGPYHYDVQIVSNLSTEDGNLLYGHIVDSELAIKVNPGYGKERGEITVLHEIIHGIDNCYNVGLEEKQVETLANTIYDVLKENGFLKEILPDV